jgi:hypothetical protein
MSLSPALPNQRRLVDGLNSTVNDGGAGGDVSIDVAVGFVGNTAPYDLDSSGFNGTTYEFPDLLPVAPDLTDNKSVIIFLIGVGPVHRMPLDATPDPGFFALYGSENRSVRFNSTYPPQAGAAAAVYAAAGSFSSPRYVIFHAYIFTALAGIPVCDWLIPDGVTLYLPAGATGTKMSASNTAAADAEFEFFKDVGAGMVSIGTGTIASGDSDATFSIASSHTLTAGDVLRLMPPPAETHGLESIRIAVRLMYVLE